MTAGSDRAGSSLDALTDLLDLRPGSADRPEPGRVRLGVVAGRRGPRFLVPLDHPVAMPQACLAYLGLRDTRTRLTRGAVGLALRAHLSKVVTSEVLTADASDGSLIATLADLLADPTAEPGLAVAVGMGHRDEVWKPTLQLFRPDGTPAAFVKVGLGPVGARLVTTESEALATWAMHPDPRLVVPRLVAAPTWRDLPIAVVAPLPTDARRLPAPASAWPVRSLDGPVRHTSLDAAPWWTRRRDALAGDARIDPLLERIEAHHGDADDLAWGRGHGDWVPWNLARCHRGLVAWDWEYSEPGTPVGLDEVHGAYQQARVVRGRSIATSLASARAEAEGFAGRSASPTSPAELRARAGTADPVPAPGRAAWLGDAHVAMLVSRSIEIERLAGEKPTDQDELIAAAADALGASR